jgi:hypothetical protein
MAPGLTGQRSRDVADRFELDHDNIRAALDWAVANGEVEIALRLIVAMWRFWQRRGHLDEARRRCDGVLAMPGIEKQPADLRARAYGAAGGVAYWQADGHATFTNYAMALRAAEESGDKSLIAKATYDHGFAGLDVAEPNEELYSSGKPYWLRSLALFKEIDDPQGIADSAWGLAQAESFKGDEGKAVEYGEQARDGYRAVGDQFGLGWALFILAGIHLRRERVDDAQGLLKESIEIFVAASDKTGILLCLAAYLFIAQLRGQRIRELHLAGTILRMRAETGTRLIDAPIDVFQFVLPTEPEDEAEKREFDAGARMNAEEAADYALNAIDADKVQLSPE